MDWTNTVIFTLWNGQQVLILDFISSILGLMTVFLAGRASKANFWVGYVYNAALFMLFWHNHLFANLLLQPISLAINIYGQYRWSHPKVEEESSGDASTLKVSKLTWRQRIFAIAMVLVVAFLWGLVLQNFFTSDPVPYLDTVVTVLILTAQLLSAMKKWDCWIAWLVVDSCQIPMHFSVGNIMMTIVCTLYLANGIWSLVSWGKKYREHE